MNKFLKYNQREPVKGDRKISYSQYAMYSTCPKHWELAYVKNLRTFSQSIHTIFGTAFHETLQNYLTVMFNESVKKANEIDINKYLAVQMHTLYKEAVEKMGGEHFSTKRELNELYIHIALILHPLDARFSTRCDPMNPSAPVTKIFITIYFFSLNTILAQTIV